MLHKSKFSIEAAVANCSGAMEADTNSKSRRSLKTLMRRKRFIVRIFLIFSIFSSTISLAQTDNDLLEAFQFGGFYRIMMQDNITTNGATINKKCKLVTSPDIAYIYPFEFQKSKYYKIAITTRSNNFDQITIGVVDNYNVLALHTMERGWNNGVYSVILQSDALKDGGEYNIVIKAVTGDYNTATRDVKLEAFNLYIGLGNEKEYKGEGIDYRFPGITQKYPEFKQEHVYTDNKDCIGLKDYKFPITYTMSKTDIGKMSIIVDNVYNKSFDLVFSAWGDGLKNSYRIQLNPYSQVILTNIKTASDGNHIPFMGLYTADWYAQYGDGSNSNSKTSWTQTLAGLVTVVGIVYGTYKLGEALDNASSSSSTSNSSSSSSSESSSYYAPKSIDNVDILGFDSRNGILTSGNNLIDLKIRNRNSYDVYVIIEFTYAKPGSDNATWEGRRAFKISGNKIETINTSGDAFNRAKDVRIVSVR